MKTKHKNYLIGAAILLVALLHMKQPTAETKSIGDRTKLITLLVETVCNVGRAASFSIHPNAPKQTPPTVCSVSRQPFSQTRQNKHVKIKEDQTRDLTSDFTKNMAICSLLDKFVLA